MTVLKEKLLKGSSKLDVFRLCLKGGVDTILQLNILNKLIMYSKKFFKIAWLFKKLITIPRDHFRVPTGRVQESYLIFVSIQYVPHFTHLFKHYYKRIVKKSFLH